MQRITGLPDEQVLAYEAQAEAALRVALDYVMDVIASRIEASAPVLASALVLVAADAGDAVPADSVPEGDGLPPGQPYISPDDLVSIPPLWQEVVADQVLPIVAQVFLDAAGHVHAGMVDASSIATLPSVGSLASEQYLARARSTFEQIGDTLWAQARSELVAGFEAGESIPQLAERLRASAGVTARTGVLVARTQVIEASNAGSFETARASGLTMVKEFIATPDLRTRPTHLAADGQRVPLDEPFIVGGFPAMFPAAPTLPPAERLNCRCTIGYLIPDKSVTQMRENLERINREEQLPGTEGPLTQLFPREEAPGFDLPARGENPPNYIRPSLRAAKTPRQLRRVWQDEAQGLTGFPFVVDAMPRGISMITAREYAEGTLQMLAQFPGARMDRIHWFDDAASSAYAQVRRGGHAIEFNMRYASETGRPKFLAARRRDVAGWDNGGATSWGVHNDANGQGVVYHEFTHILDVENTREAVHGSIVPLLIQHAQREGVTDIDDLIKRQISSYATKNYQEMIAEAGADVMVNGAAASQLSRDIFDLVRAEYRRRGFEIRAAPLVEDLGADVFPKAAAPRALSSQTVAQLRALAKERGVIVPSGTRKADLVKMLEEAPSTVPGEVLESVDQFVARVSQIKGAAPALRKLRTSVDAELRRQFDLSPYGLSTEIRGVRVATPEEWAELGRRGIIREERTNAAYSLDDREIIFSPRWRTGEGLRTTKHQFVSDHLGWSFPGYDAASADYAAGVLRHEIGHAVSRSFPTVERRTLEGDIFAQEWTVGQRERFIHLLADELGVRRPGSGESIDDWWAESATQNVARSKISGYAGDANIQEAMAEIWAVYSGRGEAATRLAQRVGKAMQDEAAARFAPIAPTPVSAIVEAPPLSRAPLAYQARQAQLREAAGRPVLSDKSRRMSGESAYVTRVEHEGGPPTVTKDYSRQNETLAQGKRSADAEELGALVDDAVGLRAPAVIRTGPRSIEESFLEGRSGEELTPWPHAITDELIGSDDGRLIGLSDILVGESDRNAGNFIRLADGRLASIDRGGAFQTPKLAGAQSPFAQHFAPEGKWSKSIDIAPADLEVIRARLEALRPEFERLGRATWYRQAMARLVDVEKRTDPNAAIRLAEARPDLAAVKGAQRAAARTQAATIATQRGNAALIARIDELVQAKASKAVIRQELDPALREAEQLYAGADQATADALRTAVDSGDAAKIRAALTRQSKASGLTPIGKAGAKAKFDPATMEGVGGTAIPDGADVIVVRRGAKLAGIETPEKAVVRIAKAPSTEKTVAKGDFTGLTRTGEAMGGNPGGLFEAGDGSRWYVKSARNPEQLRSEALALDLYRAAGIDVPDVVVGQGLDELGTGTQIASRVVEGATADLRRQLANDAYRAQLQEGFAADAWLGNWDVLGASLDNVLTTVAGAPIRIEAGGALRFRALGESKDFGPQVTELDTLRVPGRSAARAFGDMTPEQLIASAERVRKVTPAKIKALVKKHGLDPELADTLIARRADVLRRAEALAGPKSLTPREYAAKIKAAAKRQNALDAVQAGVTGHTPDIPGQPVHTIWRGVDDRGMRDAIDRYIGSDFQATNGALRQVSQKDYEQRLGREIVVSMDRALDSSRLTADVELWRAPGSGRGIFGDPATWGDDLAGFEWVDSAYSSSSAIKRIADRFTKDGGVRLRVLAPKGSKALQLSPEKSSLAKYEESAAEAEVLLARGARYRVVRDRGWTEITHPTTRQKIRVRDLDVEVIVPDETPLLPWATK